MNHSEVLSDILRGIDDFCGTHQKLAGELADTDPDRRISMALRDFAACVSMDLLTFINNQENEGEDWKKYIAASYRNDIRSKPFGT